MAKIFITGASGFIGSRVAAFVRHTGHHILAPSWSQIAKNPDQLAETINDFMPDAVIHIAALTPHNAPPAATAEDYNQSNVIIPQMMMNVCAALPRPPVFIFASTVGVYGRPINENGLVRESNPLMPQSPYAQSKAAFEEIVRHETRMRHAILRYANIPGRDAFMNYAIAVARGDNAYIAFYGAIPYVRDYIHPDDLCMAHGKVLDQLLSGAPSVTLNCGSGHGFSFPDIVKNIEKQLDKPIPILHKEARDDDVVSLVCDMQAMRDYTGWLPHHTALEEITDYAIKAISAI